MAMPPGGSFVTLVSPAGNLYVAAYSKATKAHELRESDRAFTPGSPIPNEAVLVVLSSEAGPYVSFRSLAAECKVLQGSKDKGTPAKFANYNFAQWEEWSVLPSTVPGCLAFTNRKFVYHVFEAAVHLLPNPGVAAALPSPEQVAADRRASLDEASRKAAEYARELESSKARIKALQEEASKAKQAAAAAEDKLKQASKPGQPDASKQVAALQGQLAQQEAAWSARVDTLEQTLKQRAASVHEQTAAAKDLRAQVAALQQSLEAAEQARDKALDAEREAVKLKLAAERERDLSRANGTPSPLKGTAVAASDSTPSPAELKLQQQAAYAQDKALREARDAHAALQRQLAEAQGQLASAAQREASLSQALGEAARRAEAAEARAKGAEDRAKGAEDRAAQVASQQASRTAAARDKEQEEAALRAELAQARGELEEARVGGQKLAGELQQERDELAQRAQALAHAESAAWAAVGEERRRCEWLEDQLKLHQADKARVDKAETRQLEEARAAETRALEAAQMAAGQAAQMQQQSAALEGELERVRQFAEHMGGKASEAEGKAAALLVRITELQGEKERAEANLGFLVDSLQARLRDVEASAIEQQSAQHAMLAAHEAERQQHAVEVHLLQERLAAATQGHAHPQAPPHKAGHAGGAGNGPRLGSGGDQDDADAGAVAGDSSGGKRSYRDLAIEGELGELRAKAAELAGLKQRHAELEAHVRSVETRVFGKPDKEEELRARVVSLEAQLLPLQSVAWELEQTKAALELAAASEHKKAEAVIGAQKHAADLANELGLTKEELQQLREEYGQLCAQLQAKGDAMEAMAAELNAQVCSLVAGIDRSLQEAEAAKAAQVAGGEDAPYAAVVGGGGETAIPEEAAEGAIEGAAEEAEAPDAWSHNRRAKARRRARNKAGGRHENVGDGADVPATTGAPEDGNDNADVGGTGAGMVSSEGTAEPAVVQGPVPPAEGQLRSRGKRDKKEAASGNGVQGPTMSCGDRAGRKKGPAGHSSTRPKGNAPWDVEALLALVKGHALLVALAGSFLLVVLIAMLAIR